jgi:5,10-methylene-tetrahydrofolate dehydrogenase/methenyl tetrahydrofolate cyclohydrolase
MKKLVISGESEFIGEPLGTVLLPTHVNSAFLIHSTKQQTMTPR